MSDNKITTLEYEKRRGGGKEWVKSENLRSEGGRE